VLDNTPYVENYVVEVSLNDSGNDEIVVKISLANSSKGGAYSPPWGELEGAAVIKDLKDRFRAKIRVAPDIEICNAADLRIIIYPDTSRKPIKFIDKRKNANT